MRAVLFLPPFAAVLAAYGSTHGLDGMCGYDSFLVRQFGDKSQCSPYLSSQPSLGTADGDRIEQSASNSSIWIDNTLRDVPSGYSWTFSSPCIKSRLSTEEICVFSDSTFAQGRGISLLTTAARAEFISSRPPFVNPDLTPEEVSVSYKMKEFPGKGLGLEATRQIKQGQSIMVNTPSLMIDYRSFEWLTTEEHRRLQAVAIGYLPDAHQEAVMRLSTHDDVTDMDKDEIIGKITSTNSFDIAPEKEDPEQDYKFFVTFPEISRLNHDCRPNADYRFDYTTMTHSVHALRDILPGEELSLSYTNPLAPRQERLQRLKHLWGFQCGCDSCTQNEILGAASDERVSQINSLIPEFTKDRASSRASPEMAELLINLYKQEDVWGSLYMAYTYAALEYNGIGEPQIAGKYARLALQYGLPSLGNKDNYMVEMTRLADDPRQHWSWLLRSKGNTDLEREHEHH